MDNSFRKREANETVPGQMYITAYLPSEGDDIDIWGPIPGNVQITYSFIRDGASGQMIASMDDNDFWWIEDHMYSGLFIWVERGKDENCKCI